MVGRHVNQVYATWTSFTISHSGIHSFLNARNLSNVGWQTNEPGYQSFSLEYGEIPWALQQPSGYYEQMAVIASTGLHTEAQNLKNRSVLCELLTVPVPDVTVPSRFKMNWPMILESNVMLGQLSVGCFEKFVAPSRLFCALRCKLKIQCVSFYFNRSTAICQLSLYVDSRLPNTELSQPGIYLRFARIN
ncbi:hypothetical protein EG68_07076 [Paragonimus skrjabini miyazakii]|uniref:Apple domain-containing protein n=1 Tax=Paragonimus skrjabini miyazakii TaxID=59628 RepID=A0A8S9YMT7_9TREM|nr:hypothetical protein EG68_07076 [Paragonimus skrjabini miyazakii]